MRTCEAVDLSLAEPAGAPDGLDLGGSGRVIGGYLAGLAADAADDFAEHAFERLAGGRILRSEASPYGGRCLLKQAQEVLARQVAPPAHLHRQCLVARGTLHQHAEAGVGETRAGVPDDRVDHLAV